mgnify:CR=1 FL=1
MEDTYSFILLSLLYGLFNALSDWKVKDKFRQNHFLRLSFMMMFFLFTIVIFFSLWNVKFNNWLLILIGSLLGGIITVGVSKLMLYFGARVP